MLIEIAQGIHLLRSLSRLKILQSICCLTTIFCICCGQYGEECVGLEEVLEQLFALQKHLEAQVKVGPSERSNWQI